MVTSWSAHQFNSSSVSHKTLDHLIHHLRAWALYISEFRASHIILTPSNMNYDCEAETLVACCVPIEAEHEFYQADFDTQNYSYPSASASYSYFYPVAEDDDFCDIIADLAQAEYGDEFSYGPSAVALPIAESEEDAVPALSVVASEVCSGAYASKGFEILPVKAIDEDEFMKEQSLKWGSEYESREDSLNKKVTCKKKLRRLNAVYRLKEKRYLKKHKQSSKLAEIAHSSHSSKHHLPSASAKHEKTTASSARQLATAGRERVKGKFKNNSTRWIAVTEFLRRTHIDDGTFDDTSGERVSKEQT